MIITNIFKGHYLLIVCTLLDLETNKYKSRISALEIKYTPSNYIDNGQVPQHLWTKRLINHNKGNMCTFILSWCFNNSTRWENGAKRIADQINKLKPCSCDNVKTMNSQSLIRVWLHVVSFKASTSARVSKA